VGVQLGEGKSIEQIIEDMYMVAEGVKSAPTVMQLANKYGVEMPICQDVLEVVSGRKTARQSFIGLLRTQVGSEADPG
jgi:glycerol-3-phosphate dehydrogenase (NAD(P)+)